MRRSAPFPYLSQAPVMAAVQPAVTSPVLLPGGARGGSGSKGWSHDFRYDFDMSAWNTDHRDSEASGADHAGVVRYVPQDERMFIGGRYVWNESIAPVIDWLAANATVIDEGNGVARVTIPAGTGSAQSSSNHFPNVAVLGHRFLWSFDIMATDGYAGGDVLLRTSTSDTWDPVDITRQLPASWQRWEVSREGTHATASGFRAYLIGTAGGDIEFLVKNTQFEVDVDVSSSYVPERTGQWFTTANGNTVDENGIVTEATGPSILPAEGLQLEGARTNLLTSSDPLDMSDDGTITSKQYHATIPAPDESMTAVHVVSTPTGYVRETAITAAGNRSSIWARTVTGTGTLHVAQWAGNDNPQTITEEWQRFDAVQPVGSGDTTFYAADFRAYLVGSTLGEVLIWGGQSEAAAFPSSGIPSTFDSTIRALTKQKALFSNIGIPELMTDFCGHVVWDMKHRWTELSSAWFFILQGGNTNDRVVLTKETDSTNMRLSRRVSIAGSDYTQQNASGPLAAGGLVDVRFKVTDTSMQFWLQGNRSSVTLSEPPFGGPLLAITLGSSHAVTLPEWGVFKFVRIVPEALTDEDIQDWPYIESGEPVIIGAPVVGYQLDVDTSGIVDQGGVNNVTVVWSNGYRGTPYTVQPSDAGQSLSCYVQYRDNAGNYKGPLAADPVMIYEAYQHDFTTNFDMSDWNANHRASEASGADHEGVIRYAPQDARMFIGARMASNWVTSDDISTYSRHGGVTLEVIPGGGLDGDDCYRVTWPANTEAWRGLYDLLPGVYDYQTPFASSTYARLVSADEPTALELFNSAGVANGAQFVPDGEWRRYGSVGGLPTSTSNGWRINLVEAVPYDLVVDFCRPTASIPGHNELHEWVPAQTSRAVGTELTVTVDPVTSIVTEATGPSILPAEGLQLEGARTNQYTDTTMSLWTTNRADLTLGDYNGTPTQTVIGHAFDSWHGFYEASSVTSGQTYSKVIYARPAGYEWLQLMLSNGFDLAGFVNINLTTEAIGNSNMAGVDSVAVSDAGDGWKRIEVVATATSTAPDGRIILGVYGTDVPSRAASQVQSGVDGIEFTRPQLEAATFPSSFISSAFASTTRAATKQTAQFSDIPELPDEGLTNDFCGQVVVDWKGIADLSVFELYGASNNRIYMALESGSDRIRVAAIIADTTSSVLISPIPAPGIWDIRFSKRADQRFTVWLNGAPYVHSNDNSLAEFTTAISTVYLNQTNFASTPGFGIYKQVRIVPEALSDEEIEAWPYLTSGAPFIDPIGAYTAPGAVLTYKMQLYTDPGGINNPVAKWYIDGVLSYTGPEYTVQGTGVVSCTVSYTNDSGREVNDVACSNTVESIAGLEHDFTTGGIGPFIHTRDSQAVGRYGDGVAFIEQDPDPVFIGGPNPAVVTYGAGDGDVDYAGETVRYGDEY